MKKLIFVFVLFLQFNISFGQDFNCPKEVDFGKLIVSDLSDTNVKYDNAYRVHFKAIANKEDLLYNGYKLEILYDSLIYNNGNRVAFLGMTSSSFYKDTLLFKFIISTHYYDGIDTNKYLEADFTYYYIKKGSYNLDSQKVRIKFKLSMNKTVFFNPIVYEIYEIVPKYKYSPNSDINFYGSQLVNSCKKDFIIDSVTQVIIGNNFFGYTIQSNDSLKFPDTLKANNRLNIAYFFKFIQKELGVSILNLHGHYDGFNDLVELSDTLQVIFDYYDDFYINMYPRPYYYVTYIKDTAKLSAIRFNNYTDSIVSLLSFNISSPDNLNYLYVPNGQSPPFDINPKKRGSLKDFYVFTDKIGKYKLIFTLNFEKEDGETFSEDLIYIFDVKEKSTTQVNDITHFNNLLIFPNPATDYIDIQMPEGTGVGSGSGTDRTLKDAVRVYDVLGVCVLEHPAVSRHPSARGEFVRLDVSGLAAGVYHYIITFGSEKVTGSFVIVR